MNIRTVLTFIIPWITVYVTRISKPINQYISFYITRRRIKP